MECIRPVSPIAFGKPEAKFGGVVTSGNATRCNPSGSRSGPEHPRCFQPLIKIGHLHTPAAATEFGIKGMGEGGAVAPPAAIANAVRDALSSINAEANETPITPTGLFPRSTERGRPDRSLGGVEQRETRPSGRRLSVRPAQPNRALVRALEECDFKQNKTEPAAGAQHTGIAAGAGGSRGGAFSRCLTVMTWRCGLCSTVW